MHYYVIVLSDFQCKIIKIDSNKRQTLKYIFGGSKFIVKVIYTIYGFLWFNADIESLFSVSKAKDWHGLQLRKVYVVFCKNPKSLFRSLGP